MNSRNARSRTLQKCNQKSSSENEAEEAAFRKFTKNEKRRTLEKIPVISRAKAKMALKLLDVKKENPKKLTTEQKHFNILKKHCSRHVTDSCQWRDEHQEHTWDSSMYLMKAIRASILTRNWDNIADLLLLLLKHNRQYVKQVALFLLQNNPLDDDGELLKLAHDLLSVDKVK